MGFYRDYHEPMSEYHKFMDQFIDYYVTESVDKRNERLIAKLNKQKLDSDIPIPLYNSSVTLLNYIKSQFSVFINNKERNDGMIKIPNDFTIISPMHAKIIIAFITDMSMNWGNKKYFNFLLNLLYKIKNLNIKNNQTITILKEFATDLLAMDYQEQINYLADQDEYNKELLTSAHPEYTNVINLQELFDQYRNDPFVDDFEKNEYIFELYKNYYLPPKNFLAWNLILNSIQSIKEFIGIDPMVNKFLYNEVMSRLNSWLHYSGTKRYDFRLKEEFVLKSLDLLKLDFDDNLLEIFGNIPILSLIVSHYNIKSTVIDFNFENDFGDVGKFYSDFDKKIDEDNPESAIDYLTYYIGEKDSFIDQFEQDVTKDNIKIKSIQSVTGLLIPNIDQLVKFENYNLLFLQEFEDKVKYDCIFIDPPFGINTGYMNINFEILVKNSIKLALNSAKKNTRFVITIPKYSKESLSQRDFIINELTDNNLKFDHPSKKARIVAFTI